MRNVAYGLMIAGLLVACGDDGKKKPDPEVDAGDTVPLDGNGGADGGGDTRECAQLYTGFGPYDGEPEFVTPKEFDDCRTACQLPANSTLEAYRACWADNCPPNFENSFICLDATIMSCYTQEDGGICYAPQFGNYVCCAEETCDKDQTCIETMCEDEYQAIADCAYDDYDAQTATSDVCFEQVIQTCFDLSTADAGAGDGDTGDLDAGTSDAGSTGDASVSPRPSLPRALKAASLRTTHLQAKRTIAR